MIIKRKTTDPHLPEDEHLWTHLVENFQYHVISIEYDYFRIQTRESGWKPCLYPTRLFEIIDSAVEPEWIINIVYELDGKADLLIEFPEFSATGFWEDVHDDKIESHRVLVPILRRLGLDFPVID